MPDNTDELKALRAQQVREALANPIERDRILVENVLALADAVPKLENRVSSLERFRTWLYGVGALAVVVAGILWEALRK